MRPDTPMTESILGFFSQGEARITPQIRENYDSFRDKVDEELISYWNILGDAMRQAMLPPPAAADGGPFRILNVGCGRGEDSIALSSFFSHFAGDIRPRAVGLTGVDLRENALVKARRRCLATSKFFQRELKQETQPFTFRFSATDATQLQHTGPFVEPFDLAVFRHQNMYQGISLWTKIFEQGLDHLKPDGILLITSYYDKEHRMALEVLNALDAKLQITVSNPVRNKMQHNGQSRDRHVAVFSKQTTARIL